MGIIGNEQKKGDIMTIRSAEAQRRKTVALLNLDNVYVERLPYLPRRDLPPVEEWVERARKI